MRPVRTIRFLTTVSLVIALLVVPVVADAAPMDRAESPPNLLERAWGWVESLWGAGSGGFDPTGRALGTPTPTPALAPASAIAPTERARSTATEDVRGPRT